MGGGGGILCSVRRGGVVDGTGARPPGTGHLRRRGLGQTDKNKGDVSTSNVIAVKDYALG